MRIDYQSSDARQIRACDVTVIRDLRWKVLRPNEPDASRVSYEGDTATSTIHLADFRDDVPVGCITLMQQDLAPHTQCFRLRALAVLPEFQRQGLGSALIREAERHAWEAGAKTIWLSGRTHHTMFYRQRGYEVSGQTYDIPGTGMHADFIKHGPQ